MALLAGKNALVTGAASGIGRAAALVFAREGARVIVGDTADDGGEQTVAAIRKLGGEAQFVRCDVSRASDVEAMVAAAVKTFGRLDCAFNNAGIAGTQRKTADYEEDEFDK
ncbi:MAG TPA: SDR family NAD(P)-dependent oxidoreductase, partial [Sporolactobacillaceae bacterium]|nr:SDR family NAD(P)-dependent oxidoreductase [Sporolactobacillaceae bacterium]